MLALRFRPSDQDLGLLQKVRPGCGRQPDRYTSEHHLAPWTSDGTFSPMTLKAKVHNGRLVVDEPTHLPEGTEVELLLLDPGDWLDEEDRAALHRALAASGVDVEDGSVVDAGEVLRELRSV